MVLLLIALASAAGAAQASGKGGTDSQSSQDVLGGVNQLRSATGQSMLPLDTTAKRVLEYAVGGSCPLVDCSAYGRSGAAVDESALYSALGGKGALETTVVDDADVTQDPEALALVADSRATGLAQAYDPYQGSYLLAVTLDKSHALRGQLAAPVDFENESFDAVLPQAQGAKPQLYQQSAGRLLPVNGQVSLTNGALGAVMLSYSGGRGVQLAYGAHYRLVYGSSTVDFATTALPAAFVNQSWQFAPQMSGQSRGLFLSYFAKSPALYRQIARQIDGAVQIRLGGCGDNTSCAGFDGKNYYISMNPHHLASSFGRFATMHEFGHIVDYLGLDEDGNAAFLKLFQQSPHWPEVARSMQGKNGVPFAEILADQFAFWATGQSGRPSGYDDPALCSRAAFGRVLAAYYGFRPEPGGDPVVGI